MLNTYREPVSKILSIGRPDSDDKWKDYLALGITEFDIPELIRLMQDKEMRFMGVDIDDDKDYPEWFAQIHAWRALAQLKSEAMIEPFLGILPQIDEQEDDWLGHDVRIVFGMLGPIALEPISKYLANESKLMYARIETGYAIVSIGQKYPEVRLQCIESICAVFEKYKTNDEEFNGFLIDNLLELKAIEKIDLVEQAFLSERVDISIAGDFEDIQIELGLLNKRTTPRPRLAILNQLSGDTDFSDSPIVLTDNDKSKQKKEKSKRKQEKKSRKKNRKRK